MTPGDAQGRRATRTARVELILAAADGYPYFIQEYGRVVWEEAGVSPITAAAVAEALPVAQEILDEEFFDNRVEEATNEERRYMAAMADLGDGPQSTGEVTARAGYKQRASSGKARQALIRKGLIYVPEHGTRRLHRPPLRRRSCAAATRSRACPRPRTRTTKR